MGQRWARCCTHCIEFSFGTWPSNPPIQFKSHRIRVHAAPLLVSFRSLGRPVGKICSRFRFVKAAYTCPEIINLQPPCFLEQRFSRTARREKKRSIDKLQGVNTKLHSKCTRHALWNIEMRKGSLELFLYREKERESSLECCRVGKLYLTKQFFFFFVTMWIIQYCNVKSSC